MQTSIDQAMRHIIGTDTGDQFVTHDLEVAPGGDPSLMQREWLITNGAGGYAMGTIAGVNTRRYHGLLIAAAQPPVGRVVVLNQMFERLSFEQVGQHRPVEWTTCTFRGADGEQNYAPSGFEMLQRFRRGLSVAWVYRHGAVQFTRKLTLHWKQQAATLCYTVEGLKQPATLSLQPMLTLRDFHSLLHLDKATGFDIKLGDRSVTVRGDDHAVTLGCDCAEFVEDPSEWFDVYYPVEALRGQDDHEDHYLPGKFEIPLDPHRDEQTITVTVALGDDPVEPCPNDAVRRAHLVPMLDHLGPTIDDRTRRMLVIAADDFVVDRTHGEETLSTIMAGYPWFADWGRDTFIALPGLLLATGRFDAAAAVLRIFAESIHDGLVPNRFDDYDDHAAHYNTVDASLWFIRAALDYVEQSRDHATWDAYLATSVVDVLEAYITGTRYDIAVTGDGLISAGSAQTQLTWMDAACDGTVFTPRFGKAVEINALWYHALVGTAALIRNQDANAADHYTRLAGRVKRAFTRIFWDDKLGCMRDHIWTDASGNGHVDNSLRPNQVLALSLPHSPLPRTKQRIALATIRDRLLTPYGLRTLPRDDPNYHGRYAGSPYDRDAAYHQGTVWPWLIGPYAEAVLRIGQFDAKAVHEARCAIQPLLCFLDSPGLGQLHEIHEAEPPHAPAGCIAQAWSIAEVIRVVKLIEAAESGGSGK